MDVGKYVVHALLSLVLMIGLGAGWVAHQRWDERSAFSWLIPAPWRYPLPQAWKTVRVTGGYAVQLADARQQAKTSLGAALACQGQLRASSDRVKAQADEGAHALAQVRQDLAAADAEGRALSRALTGVSGYHPVGSDVCARWEDADRHVLAGLKQ